MIDNIARLRLFAEKQRQLSMIYRASPVPETVDLLLDILEEMAERIEALEAELTQQSGVTDGN